MLASVGIYCYKVQFIDSSILAFVEYNKKMATETAK